MGLHAKVKAQVMNIALQLLYGRLIRSVILTNVSFSSLWFIVHYSYNHISLLLIFSYWLLGISTQSHDTLFDGEFTRFDDSISFASWSIIFVACICLAFFTPCVIILLMFMYVQMCSSPKSPLVMWSRIMWYLGLMCFERLLVTMFEAIKIAT